MKMEKCIDEVSMSFNDHQIHSKDGLICLTDLWKAAGEPEGKHDPRQWKIKAGHQFIESVAKKLNVPYGNIYKAVR